MTKPTIAVIGGTGAEGTGLAFRWAAAGYPIVIGSRSAEKAVSVASELAALLPAGSAPVHGAANPEAAAAVSIVVLSVPYDAQAATIDAVREAAQGKLVITVVVPVKPPRVTVVWHPPGESAAQEAQAQFGDGVKVVAAFQNISAKYLKELSWQPDCDILVTGDDKSAKQTTIELAQVAGFRGIDAGPLANSSVVEGLTAVLRGINVRNKVKDSGIRITGLPEKIST
jgi:NADPH-dependent F420 reductase